MADTSKRNSDFPSTYISAIAVDLAGQTVTLAWAGTKAGEQPTGPFHCSPGAGVGGVNCDDTATSNKEGSNCTPKGSFKVEGFADYLGSHPNCKFVTWFQKSRGIAFHSHTSVPKYPASHGCVRMQIENAQLIHNNARAGVTTVSVGGKWQRGHE